uniref:UDENN domain-containing protein n=1 Tax=Clastoptera arizonana TaxID=38151 RepID=A0A1B6EAM3_9HEMI
MENRSRVGDIRKKFEVLNSSQKFKDHGLKHSQPPLNPVLSSSLAVNSFSQIEGTQSTSSNSANKGNIKRSHAFRSEKQPKAFGLVSNKMVAADKNKFNITKPEETFGDLSQIKNNQKMTTRCNSVKREPEKINVGFFKPNLKNDVKISNLNKSKTDYNFALNKNRLENNLTEKIEGRHNSQETYSIVLKPNNRTLTKNIVQVNSPHDSNNKPILSTEKTYENKDNEVIRSNSKFDKARNKVPNVSFSFNELQAAFENKSSEINLKNGRKNVENEVLQSPLPKGPPPKKPPRTFAHNVGSTSSSPSLSNPELAIDNEKEVKPGSVVSRNTLTNKTIQKPVRSKTESQIMLKKIEIALLNHQKGVINSNFKSRNSSRHDLIPSGCHEQHFNTVHRRSSLEKEKSITNDEVSKIFSNLCMKSLNCSSSNSTKISNIYESPFEPKSTFFANETMPPKIMDSNRDLSEPNTNFNKQLFSNKEHIYAEPIKDNLKNDVISSSGQKVGQLAKIDPPINELHYMSTPILDRPKIFDSFKSNCGSGKKVGQHFTEAVNLHILINKDGSNFSTKSSLDKNKVQMMVNEAYGKCLNLPPDGGSDSDSVASTPDDAAIKTVCDHEVPSSTEFVLNERDKEREQRTAERKGYLRRISSRGKSFHRPASVSDVSSNQSNLFEFVLLVGLDLDPSRCKVPYIKSKFPPDVMVPNGIESLCFPDACDWPPQGCKDESVLGGCYCLVLTNSSGTRKYGYCRRVQPEGAAICLPLAYCVVSTFKDNWFFNKILVELESHHGQTDYNLTNFIEELYKCRFPSPGQGVFVTQPSTGKRVEIVRRPYDPRQEEIDIARLLNIVRLSVFLQLFGTLLLERKIVLLSYSISRLSACIEGLQAALYPFHWQHTLVPVVPSNMIDLCHAPTPYIIGLLKHRTTSVEEPLSYLKNVDEVLVVDIDDIKVLRSMNDENSVLPSRLSRGLKTALQLAMAECINSAAVTTNANLIASEAIIRLFVELLGHYRDHIITSTDTGNREFQRENFVKSASSNSKKYFLDWFSETSMFTAFIEERLDRNISYKGLFEQRCVEYLSDRSQPGFLKNYKGINKTVKTLGDRLKDWAALS